MTDLSFEEFETQLQKILNHFYNPLFHPDAQVLKILGVQPAQGMDAVQHVIKGQIENLRPSEGTPAGALSRRFYEILNYRYLASLSQEKASFLLGMTSRNLRRYQQQAIHILARGIWDAHLNEGSSTDPLMNSMVSGNPERPTIIHELEVLQRNSPGIIARIGESVERVRAISRAVVNAKQITLNGNGIEPQLSAQVHPSVLDQILLSTIELLAQNILGSEIRFSTNQQGNRVEVALSAAQRISKYPITISGLVPEVLALIGGSQSVRQDGQDVRISFWFPIVTQVPVLLIDDNADFYHLFRRYIQNTRYVLHGIREGARLQEALDEIHPEIIVLDVLLPDMDGWQLLIALQNPVQYRPVPVVICSALGQKELAFSLGARAYLPKPVSRNQFLSTLDGLID